MEVVKGINRGIRKRQGRRMRDREGERGTGERAILNNAEQDDQINMRVLGNAERDPRE